MTKAYPTYKDSGVEWLGEVPEGWKVVRLKHACYVFPSNVDKLSVEGEIPVSLCNYTDVYYRETITPHIEFMQATARPDEIEKFSLKIGDVIFTKDSETADDIGIAALVEQELPGVVCGYHLSIARPYNGVSGPFVKRFFDSRFAKACFQVSANGLTRVGLGQSAIDNVAFPLPPLPEQTAIAAFLDRETAKIDALVAEQRRLVDLLREKRQAVISHAVTKGLNPNAPLKPSGIDWLGDVPAHWNAPLSFKRVANRVVVGIAEAAAYAYVEVGVPILRSMNVRAGKIIGDLLYLDPSYSTDRDSKALYAGDLITVRTGHAGVTAVVPQELDGCQCFTMLITTLKKGMCPEYFCYWMNSVHAVYYFGLEAWGSAQPNISVPILQDIPVFAPPTVEQKAIAEFLDHTTSKLDTLTATAETAISLLQERRAALISAAVTGKIDVRQSVTDEVAA